MNQPHDVIDRILKEKNAIAIERDDALAATRLACVPSVSPTGKEWTLAERIKWIIDDHEDTMQRWEQTIRERNELLMAAKGVLASIGSAAQAESALWELHEVVARLDKPKDNNVKT